MKWGALKSKVAREGLDRIEGGEFYGWWALTISGICFVIWNRVLWGDFCFWKFDLEVR